MVDGIPIFQKVRRKGSQDRESGVLAGRRIEGRNSNGGAKLSSAVREALEGFDLFEPITIGCLLALRKGEYRDYTLERRLAPVKDVRPKGCVRGR